MLRKKKTQDHKTEEMEIFAIFWHPGFVPNSDFSAVLIHSDKKGIVVPQGHTLSCMQTITSIVPTNANLHFKPGRNMLFLCLAREGS